MSDDEEDIIWPLKERRRTHREELKTAVLEAAEEFWGNKQRVRAVVGVLLACIADEMEAGASRALFSGLRTALKRIGWFCLFLAIAFAIAGWPGVTAYLKAALFNGPSP